MLSVFLYCRKVGVLHPNKLDLTCDEWKDILAVEELLSWDGMEPPITPDEIDASIERAQMEADRRGSASVG